MHGKDAMYALTSHSLNLVTVMCFVKPNLYLLLLLQHPGVEISPDEMEGLRKCELCHLSFSNLAKHMRAKHPGCRGIRCFLCVWTEFIRLK